jgi:hypothetical protein
LYTTLEGELIPEATHEVETSIDTKRCYCDRRQDRLSVDALFLFKLRDLLPGYLLSGFSGLTRFPKVLFCLLVDSWYFHISFPPAINCLIGNNITLLDNS